MATITAPTPANFPGVTLRNIDWTTYCKLRDDPANDSYRMTYLDGDLTILSPQIRHDNRSRWLYEIVTTVARACLIRFKPIGATTLRRPDPVLLGGAGKEPDDGFYLGDAVARVPSDDELDLAIDPPPSLAIEVDNTATSESALPSYARIGVPEVWIYKVREHAVWFGGLVGGRYETIDRSLGLPRLTTALVLEALDARLGGLDDFDWQDWLEGWARALPKPPAPTP